MTQLCIQLKYNIGKQNSKMLIFLFFNDLDQKVIKL